MPYILTQVYLINHTHPLLFHGRVFELLEHLEHLVYRDSRMRGVVVDALEVAVCLVLYLLRELLAHLREDDRHVTRLG